MNESVAVEDFEDHAPAPLSVEERSLSIRPIPFFFFLSFCLSFFLTFFLRRGVGRIWILARVTELYWV